ncbi:hypothetical protein KQH82_07315 [bacterium]|nr:hypothetical protein [bacterium]
MEARIMTKHPEGKAGVNILKRRYDTIKDAILDELSKREETPFNALLTTLSKRLKTSFDGKVGWYVVTVKLDLEARGKIERVDNPSPQRLRLKKR